MKKVNTMKTLVFNDKEGLRLFSIKIELKSKNDKFVLSMSGHTCTGHIGQCAGEIKNIIATLPNDITKEQVNRILEVWEEYHLNDMEVWCEHNNYGNKLPEQEYVNVYKMWYTEEARKLSKIREFDEPFNKSLIDVTEEGLKNLPKALYRLWDNKQPNRTCTGHISYDAILSPEGLIGKVCPVCGAKYGHEWYFKPIPGEVILEIIGWFQE